MDVDVDALVGVDVDAEVHVDGVFVQVDVELGCRSRC